MNKSFKVSSSVRSLNGFVNRNIVSCKDYDEDIDRIDKELVDIKSALSALLGKS